MAFYLYSAVFSFCVVSAFIRGLKNIGKLRSFQTWATILVVFVNPFLAVETYSIVSRLWGENIDTLDGLFLFGPALVFSVAGGSLAAMLRPRS